METTSSFRALNLTVLYFPSSPSQAIRALIEVIIFFIVCDISDFYPSVANKKSLTFVLNRHY